MVKKLKTFLAAVVVMFMIVVEAQAYTFTTLDYPGDFETWANDINDSGDVVGYYLVSSVKHGFIYAGIYTTLDVPGGPLGINNSGDVVGYYLVSNDQHGFIYDDSAGTYTTLDVPGASHTVPMGINDSGRHRGTLHR